MPKQKYAKIAISLPRELLDEIEKRCAARGESRSEVVREAIHRMMRDEERRRIDEEYRRAYEEQPVTPEEVAWIEAANRASAKWIAEEYPWEEDE